LYFGKLTYIVVHQFIIAQSEADENPEGEGASKDVAATGHDTPKETFARGASAARMTGNGAEVEVHAAEVLVTRAPETDVTKIPERVEIPRQLEV
jgi:hypothetical protein